MRVCMYKWLIVFIMLFCFEAVAAEMPTYNIVALSGTKTSAYRLVGLNPDCTVRGVPVVRLTKPPAKGSVDIEEVMRYSNYNKDDQRYNCNKKQSAQAVVWYTSSPGFKGNDQFEIETFWVMAGTSTKTRHKVSVGAAPAATESRNVISLSGTKVLTYSVFSINPDCTVLEVPVVKLTKPPAKGSVDIEDGMGYSNFAKDTQSYECNTKQSEMINVWYTSAMEQRETTNLELSTILPRL
jgi:hypothetical protein